MFVFQKPTGDPNHAGVDTPLKSSSTAMWLALSH